MKLLYDDRLEGEDDVWINWRFNNRTLVSGWRTHADWFALAGYGPHDYQVTMRIRMVNELTEVVGRQVRRHDIELAVDDLIEKGWHRW